VWVGFYIGASFGSFLNVVVYRLPRGMSLVQPPSHCPNCKHRLGVLDLLPILSWILSRGRCRYCGQKISPRYLAVEVVTGAVWAGFWWKHLVMGSDPALFLLYVAFATILLAALFIDIEHYLIPDSLNALLLPVAVVHNVYVTAAGKGGTVFVGELAVPMALAGYLLGFGVLFGIALLGRVLLRKDAMGHGDIKLARGIGAMIGPGLALGAFALAIVLGTILGTVQVAVRRQEEDEADEEAGEDESWDEPESVGSLLRCGLGYLLLLDVWALFFPKINQVWFGDTEASSEESEDDWEPTVTTIPFGPYLAVGAILAALFPEVLVQAGEMYLRWTGLAR
jgi:leader peptidase (prepilin peptidase)/N-methyltransferase